MQIFPDDFRARFVASSLLLSAAVLVSLGGCLGSGGDGSGADSTAAGDSVAAAADTTANRLIITRTNAIPRSFATSGPLPAKCLRTMTVYPMRYDSPRGRGGAP